MHTHTFQLGCSGCGQNCSTVEQRVKVDSQTAACTVRHVHLSLSSDSLTPCLVCKVWNYHPKLFMNNTRHLQFLQRCCMLRHLQFLQCCCMFLLVYVIRVHELRRAAYKVGHKPHHRRNRGQDQKCEATSNAGPIATVQTSDKKKAHWSSCIYTRESNKIPVAANNGRQLALHCCWHSSERRGSLRVYSQWYQPFVLHL